VIAVTLLIVICATGTGLGATGARDAALSGASNSASIVVNSADDTADGRCDAVHCSLRDALVEAGDLAGPDTIVFAIPMSDPSYDAVTGVWTLEAARGYLVPMETTIDVSIPTGGGSSKPGIEIDATTEAQYSDGLRLNEGVTLRGLVVNGFGYGIWVAASDVTIEGCYVGTDPTGTTAKLNNLDGILLARGVTGTVIQDSLISGNRGSGIRAFGDPTEGNTIRRNHIGCTADGSMPLPNGSNGIKLHGGTHDNTIGPTNLIAYNGRSGVMVTEYLTHGNTITQNSIHSNGTEGILLSSGGNDELPRPRVYSTSTRTEVVGSACAHCVIEIFTDAWNQGEILEGTVTADASGAWIFTKPAGLLGLHVTATATDDHGSTSEFSEPVRLPPPATPTATRTATLIATLTPTRTATRFATRTATATRPAEWLPIYLPIIGREWR
jgi:CSLREA domain-containing protein